MSGQFCVHCFISGKVQGVWFRASTKVHAHHLGVTGWVRNVEDGRVEVMACGSREQLANLLKWLQHGPRLAEVSDVTCEELPWQVLEGFEVR